MGTSYTWHQGSDWINPRWGIPVALLPDEILSSWLLRAALSFGCDPLVLTSSIWPKWRIWTTDLDRSMEIGRLKSLSYISGIPSQCIEASMLKKTAVLVAGKELTSNRVWPWILALGSRNRRRNGGLQYCPECLSRDLKPYFRIQWRFAWHTACVEHQVLLIDRCPTCKAPLEPSRLSVTDGTLTKCPSCKSDIRNVKGHPAILNAMLFQKQADRVVLDQKATYGSNQIESSEWFCLTRHFISLIRRASCRNTGKFTNLIDALQINTKSDLIENSGVFELLPVMDRAILVSESLKLLTAGPQLFLKNALSGSVTVQALKASRDRVPACFDKILQELPTHQRKPYTNSVLILSNKPRTKAQVMRMWAQLLRKIPKVNRNE